MWWPSRSSIVETTWKALQLYRSNRSNNNNNKHSNHLGHKHFNFNHNTIIFIEGIDTTQPSDNYEASSTFLTVLLLLILAIILLLICCKACCIFSTYFSFMLSSKKKLISCLLQQIATDAACRNVAAASTPAAVNVTSTPCTSCHQRQHQHQSQQQQQRHSNSNCQAADTPLSDEVHHRSSKSLFQKVWDTCCASAPREDVDDANRRRNHHQALLDEATCSEDTVLQEEARRLLKTLSLRELRHLWEAIQSGGRREGECVLVEQQPRTRRTTTSTSAFSWQRQRHQLQQQQRRHRSAFCEQQRRTKSTTATSEYEPIMISCNCGDDEDEEEIPEMPIDPRLRLSLRWRWPSLDVDHLSSASLRPLPNCHQHILGRHQNRNYHSLCINPYHWALLVATTADILSEDAPSSSSSSRNNGPAAANRTQSPEIMMSADYHHQHLFGGGSAQVNHQALPPVESSQPPHQYYYTPCPQPLTPPPSYHSEADTAELVFDAASPAPKFTKEDVVDGGGKTSAGNKRRLPPIRESNNVARNNHHPHHNRNSKWCRVAYWEFRDRIGDRECKGNTVNLLTDSDLDGVAADALETETVELSRYLEMPESRQQQQEINLQSFFRTRGHPTNELARTRAKIGLGVTLFREENNNNVWLYNRSTCPVFVSSRTFTNQNQPSQPHPSSNSGILPVPMKVPPGHIIKAYDFAIASRLQQKANHTHNSHYPHLNHHPHKHYPNVHHEFSFSFVKGFGAKYSRPDTLQCPCWVEVFLEPPCTSLSKPVGRQLSDSA